MAAAVPGTPGAPDLPSVIWEDLPGGWRKRMVRRASGVSLGKWDVYLYSPNGKTIRSNNDMVSFLMQYPEEAKKIDPYKVHMDKPGHLAGGFPEGKYSSATMRVIKLVEEIQQGKKEVAEVVASMSDKIRPSAVNYNNSEQSKNYRRRRRKDYHGSHASGSGVNGHNFHFPITNGKLSKGKLSISQSIELERYFVQHKTKPSKPQMMYWANKLKADYRLVIKWFDKKWRAKLDYEYQKLGGFNGNNNDDFDESAASFSHNVSRQLRKFDAPQSLDDDDDDDRNIEDNPEYTIGYENPEADEDLDHYNHNQMDKVDEGETQLTALL